MMIGLFMVLGAICGEAMFGDKKDIHANLIGGEVILIITIYFAIPWLGWLGKCFLSQ